MPRRPFEALIQDLVYNLDVGSGLQIVRALAYFFLVVAVVLVFTATQFFAFSEPEAMEYAQLGRNLSETGALTTQVVRPSTMRFLIENKVRTVVDDGKATEIGGDPRMADHPDILHPPVYPALLAGWFKLLRVDFAEVPQGGKYPPELAIVALCHLFAVGTGLLVWQIGRRLFSPRVGFLAMTVFFLSDLVWTTSVSGTNLTVAGFFVVAASLCALITVERREDEDAPALRWVVPFLGTAVCCVLMVLTRYGSVVMVPALALYLWIGFPRRGAVAAMLLLVLFAVGMSPWLMRNERVAGAPLGFVPQSAYIGTKAYLEDTFERTLAPGLEELTLREKAEMIQRKWFRNTEDLYRVFLSRMGEGIVVCLFFAAFLHRFVRRNVHQFRWCILFGLALFLSLAGYFTLDAARLAYLFWPLVILYGLAFYYYMLDRLNLPMAVQRMAVTTLVVLLSAAPLVLNLMRRESYPYPPYLRPYITYVSELLEPSELMCTDMPWATAWYGDRTSLLLPQTIDEFYEIHDLIHEVDALYFTTLTRNQPFIRGLVLGKERSWYPLQQMQTPATFPLQHGTYLLQGDQLLLTDRDRAGEQGRAQAAPAAADPAADAEGETPAEP